MEFSKLDLTDPGRLRAIAFDLRVAADTYEADSKLDGMSKRLVEQFSRQAAESRVRADQLEELADKLGGA